MPKIWHVGIREKHTRHISKMKAACFLPYQKDTGNFRGLQGQFVPAALWASLIKCIKLNSLAIGLARTDTDDLVDIAYEDFSVSDFARSCRFDDRVGHLIHACILYDHF